MKVSIINAYVRENAGDAALLAVTLDQVRLAFPSAEVVICGMESPNEHPEFLLAPNVGSLRQYVSDGRKTRAVRNRRRLVWGSVSLALLGLPLAIALRVIRWLPFSLRGELTAVAGSDVVVSMGGGYLNGRGGMNGYQNVWFVLYPIIFALRHRRGVALASQSYGPFSSKLQRQLVGAVLRRCSLVGVREEVSAAELRSCGLLAADYARVADSGFLFAPQIRGGARSGKLGITARNWLPADAQSRYEAELASFIDYASEDKGFEVILIPQVATAYLGDDDRLVNSRIAQLCTGRSPTVVTDCLDAWALKQLYAECEVVVGTRFHSVIFSLSAGVPCIAIEYEHKTRGIMAELGLEEWVIRMEDVASPRLKEMLDALLRSRDDYMTTLASRLPRYVATAQNFPMALRVAATLGDGPSSISVGSST